MKIARQSTPEPVPATPWNVLRGQRWTDDPVRQIVQVERFSHLLSYKDKAIAREAIAMRFDMLAENFQQRAQQAWRERENTRLASQPPAESTIRRTRGEIRLRKLEQDLWNKKKANQS